MFKHLAAILAVLALVFTHPVLAKEGPMLRTISVSGHGEMQAVPDVATVSIGVNTQGATAAEALESNNKAMRTLFEMLKKAGIEARDISTSNFSVGPRYNYDNNTQPPKIMGYDVTNMVNVTVRKVEDVGESLDLLVSSGSNLINGVYFSVSKADTLLDDARIAAIADAKRKAELYARAAGVKLGNIVSINEASAAPPPIMYQGRAKTTEANDVPIAQGEQTLSTNVTVTYELQ
jgi:uncharacterized protein